MMKVSNSCKPARKTNKEPWRMYPTISSKKYSLSLKNNINWRGPTPKNLVLTHFSTLIPHLHG